MTFTLTIDCDNAAFEDFPMTEIARILEETAKKIHLRGLDGVEVLRDINGNTVGKVTVYD